jgi:hypothetical protein
VELISVLPFSPGPWSNDKVIVWGIFCQPLERYFTQPQACSWGDLLFCHSFLIVPETPAPLLWWDLLSQLKAQILLLTTISAAPSFRNKQIPQCGPWNNCRVSQDGPPYSKQYPLKPEGRWGFIPIINSFKKHQGLLITFSSPYNTPILAIHKGPNKWRLVQDLWLIETVIPLHPIVPIPILYWLKYPQKPNITLC